MMLGAERCGSGLSWYFITMITSLCCPSDQYGGDDSLSPAADMCVQRTEARQGHKTTYSLKRRTAHP